jgi:hypothetical protein
MKSQASNEVDWLASNSGGGRTFFWVGFSAILRIFLGFFGDF